jgi:hypothetical protein
LNLCQINLKMVPNGSEMTMSLFYCGSLLLFLSVSVAAHVWGDHIVSLCFCFFAGFVAHPILSQIVSEFGRNTSEEE